jgi:hypothetical protein
MSAPSTTGAAAGGFAASTAMGALARCTSATVRSTPLPPGAAATCLGLTMQHADLNECVDGTHLCSAHANCTNTPVGSYSCNCSSGYAGTGRHCVDINECDAANGGCDMFCLNHDGGYSCACASRFRLRADGLACDDIDECTADNGGCGPAQFFTCTNQLGAPAQCSGGYPACAAGSGPSQLYRDCNGACFTAELTNLGDQFCDDGAGIPNLNCSDWRFDSGDC